MVCGFVGTGRIVTDGTGDKSAAQHARGARHHPHVTEEERETDRKRESKNARLALR